MQTELFYESIDDAYRDGINQCGGFKRIGAEMWPELSPDEAGRKLRNCIDSSRAEKLNEQQRMWLLRFFRDQGFHGLMHYLADESGYDRPRTVDPDDQEAELHRQLDASLDRTESLVKRLERIQAARTAMSSPVRGLR